MQHRETVTHDHSGPAMPIRNVSIPVFCKVLHWTLCHLVAACLHRFEKEELKVFADLTASLNGFAVALLRSGIVIMLLNIVSLIWNRKVMNTNQEFKTGIQ